MGIGICTYGEICAIGPSPRCPRRMGERDGEDRAVGKGHGDDGVSPTGRGEVRPCRRLLRTSWGAIDDMVVLHGDTSIVQYGIGTFGSRATAVGGTAPRFALQELKTKLKKFGAMLLESEDVNFGGGLCTDKATGKSVSFGEMAVAAYRAKRLPPNTEPGLVATHGSGSRRISPSPLARTSW